MHGKWMKVGAMVVALGAGATARAQGAQAEATSPAFEQACVDLIHGRVPPGGEGAIKTLRSACAGLMDARTSERAAAEERAAAQRELARAEGASPAAAQGTGAGPGQPGVQVQPGRSNAAPQQGTGVLAAFEQAGRELAGPSRGVAMGMKRNGGPVGFTLLTNPIGWFNGVGINAEAFGSILPKVSWVGGARYSSTDATNGNATTFGVEGGADYFIIGRNNEGLRVGPRVEVAFGRESFQSGTNFGWLGMSGEVGYNFIATNGITGAVAGGLGGRISGHKRENFASFTGGEFGPYLKLGVGYSW